MVMKNSLTLLFCCIAINITAQSRAVSRPISFDIRYNRNESANSENSNISGVYCQDVDKNIPITNATNNNTFVLVIANENYYDVANVKFAINDGTVFCEYCRKTLGIPQRNIIYCSDATFGKMRKEIRVFTQLLQQYPDSKAIIYYTGHGIPDEKSRYCYLLPVDADATDVETAYSVDELYKKLAETGCSSIIVLLDACFSGANKGNNDNMLYAAKGVAVKERIGIPQGNMVVLSATSAQETAQFFEKGNHGLFTYFLLQKLQNTAGDVTIYKLSEYITEHVRRESLNQSRKLQSPTIMSSPSLTTDWKDWKLTQ